jgi:hypothetical protein
MPHGPDLDVLPLEERAPRAVSANAELAATKTTNVEKVDAGVLLKCCFNDAISLMTVNFIAGSVLGPGDYWQPLGGEIVDFFQPVHDFADTVAQAWSLLFKRVT